MVQQKENISRSFCFHNQADSNLMGLDMDIEKTRQYYKQLTEEDICNCAYCRNYVNKIRSAYMDLARYLDELGADIEKPFETIPVGLENGIMFYSGVQYIIIGSVDGFKETSLGDLSVFITDSHPMTNIKEDHFVIEISPIYLKWNGDQ